QALAVLAEIGGATVQLLLELAAAALDLAVELALAAVELALELAAAAGELLFRLAGPTLPLLVGVPRAPLELLLGLAAAGLAVGFQFGDLPVAILQLGIETLLVRGAILLARLEPVLELGEALLLLRERRGLPFDLGRARLQGLDLLLQVVKLVGERRG